MTDPLHDRLEAQLFDLDPRARDMTLLRFGGALIVLTNALLGAYISFYARKTLVHGARFARSLGVLAVVALAQHALTYWVDWTARAIVKTVRTQLTKRTRVSDRLALVIAAVIVAGFIYGLYRLSKWCVAPLFDTVLESDQSTMEEYIHTDEDDTVPADD